MDIGASAIVEVRVWFPYEIKHLDMNSHFLHGPHELESFVHPRLSEIGVHRVGLEEVRLGSVTRARLSWPIVFAVVLVPEFCG